MGHDAELALLGRGYRQGRYGEGDLVDAAAVVVDHGGLGQVFHTCTQDSKGAVCLLLGMRCQERPIENRRTFFRSVMCRSAEREA